MKKDTTNLKNVIEIDQARLQEHLGELVRGSGEETLNALLDAEADRLCNAERYERTEARKDTRAGSYKRKPQTRVGEVCRTTSYSGFNATSRFTHLPLGRESR